MILSFKNFPSTIFKKFNFGKNFILPRRLQGGFIENSLNYIKNVYLDYQNVYFDTIQDIRQRPIRASIIGSILFAGFYSIKHNPNEKEYQIQLVDANNRISRVPEAIRNNTSCNYVHEMFQMNNTENLRHLSLGLFSVIYSVEYSPKIDLFQAHCIYLKPSWFTIHERIKDIGFLDQFWFLHYKMRNYDINENEWKNEVQVKQTSS